MTKRLLVKIHRSDNNVYIQRA